MFDYHSLVDAAPDLEELVGSAEEALDEALRRALRRQVAVPTQSPIRYPTDEALLASLRERMLELPPELVPHACTVLLSPQIVVPYTEPAHTEGGVCRSAVLGSVAVDASGTPQLVMIDVQSVTATKGRFAPTVGFTCAVATASGDSIADSLESLYLRSTRPFRAHAASANRAMWLGGDRDDGTLPRDAICRIEAALAVRGYRAEVVQRPLRSFSSVKERLHNNPPDAVLVWTPHATPADYNAISRGRFAVLMLDEVDFDDALLLARFLLDDHSSKDEEVVAPPTSWEEFDLRLSEIECESFAIANASAAFANASRCSHIRPGCG